MKKTLINHSARGAFTMVEMLIALAVLTVLLAVIFIPIRAGFESFNVGKAKVDNQTAMQNSLFDMERDLRRAVYVFPNRTLAGVTGRAPFVGAFTEPYIKSVPLASASAIAVDENATPTKGVCQIGASDGTETWSNASRVDMVLARTGANGVVLPIEAGATIVSYYPRRLDISQPYDPIDNPLVLFRAEIPFRSSPVNGGEVNRIRFDGAVVTGTATNIQYNALVSERFPASCTAADQVKQNLSSLWIEHNVYGEANLQPIATNGVSADNANTTTSIRTDAVPASHTLAIPRGLYLVSSSALKAFDYTNPYTYDGTMKKFVPPMALAGEPPIEAPLVPDSSFDLSDTNGDGKIDRVNISLAIGTLDASNAANIRNGKIKGQQLRVTRTVNLPNVR